MSTSRHSKKETAPKIDFEKTLAKLDGIIAKLETGDLSLEESIKQFEQGTTLLKDCNKVLNAARQKVKILSEKNRELQLEDFEEDGRQ